jgi:hypothetical protein
MKIFAFKVALFVWVVGAAMFVAPARAQRGVAFAGAGRVGRTGPGTARIGGLRGGLVQGHHARRFFAGPAIWPYFYDDDSGPEIIEPPAEIVPQAPAGPPAPSPNPSESLVLELQGDHWVRLTGSGVSYGQAQTGQTGQVSAERASAAPSVAAPAAPSRSAAEPASLLPRAVLVFRDGHNEEIGKYVIVGGTIYTSADYWTTGSWTRRVTIAELDVPATLKLNLHRGARFALPSGPNEVMMRP